jgi:hypothetical protein
MRRKVFIRNKKMSTRMLYLIVGSMLTCSMFTGCGKKAETISDYGSGDTVAEASADSGDNSAEEKSEGNSADREVQSEKWNETLAGDGKLFDSVDIAANYKINEQDRHIVTVQADEYNKDFAKKMCASVFGGKADVYDYSAKTKKIYDAEIELYKDIKTMYEAEDVYMLHDGLTDDVYAEMTGVSEDELGPALFKKSLPDLDKKIEECEKAKESAPETIENDYSYGGYIGDILGEEYYMFLGNRNYDEYVSSPIEYGMEYDGRIVTICRSDLKSAFDGKVGFLQDSSSAQYYSWIENDIEQEERMLESAKEFVETIGYGDYKYNGEEPKLGMYVEGVMGTAMLKRGFPECCYKTDKGESVYLFEFTLGGEAGNDIGGFDVRFVECDKSKDLMNTNSVIRVFMSEKGVLACTMVNPLEVKKIDVANSIISPGDAKDIIKDNINNEAAWNKPVINDRKSLMLTKFRLISFPLKSKEDKYEYTYVPAYILYHEINPSDMVISNADELRNEPFILINALDGSIIKVQEELTDYPKGYQNGNVGYEALLAGKWKRVEGTGYSYSFYNLDSTDKIVDGFDEYYRGTFNSETDAEENTND